MMTTLDQVVDIRTLMIFRDKAPVEVDDGNARVISIRDIVAEWPPTFEELPLVEVTEAQLSQKLRATDIIMPARGTNYPARIFPDTNEVVFPVGQIYVIRTTSDNVLPDFLVWYLNSTSAQQAISSSVSGAVIKALNKSRLLQLGLEIPNLSTQHRIIRLQKLLDTRKKVSQEIDRLTSLEVQLACSKLLKDCP
ncbi:restriction endonuclease subunit S [Massilia sp. G4R7]|uniref:Restriction endonuclease subunit S n=1 Tax=Massilia phyllostachyos TaxID=2898585 RepID=A0ABS8Q7P2_9BURK|nr:restriction endonuclease subunit S [Massilia phyllostachyos]MCD2517770.1 restriction endonuclease subunit S [Massilia phyllostachyos]